MGVATGFSYGGDAPPPDRPSQVAHGKSRDRQQLLCALSEGCVLFHINDKEGSGSKKSLSYTHLFKKSQPHNTVGGSPQESSESWGLRQWQKTETTSLFVPETRAAQFQNAVGLHQNQGYHHAFQWVFSCIKKEALLHSTVTSLSCC